MINELGLLVRNDIPFPEAQLVIHQPTLKEIGYIGEQSFFIGCQLLTITRDKIEQDTGQQTNFDIFMTIINDKSPVSQKNKLCAQQVLLLLFPKYKISFLPNTIIFAEPPQTQGEKPELYHIDASNFDKLGEYIKKIFVLDDIFHQSGGYNIDAKSAKARSLQKKFQQYHKKLAKIKKQENDGQSQSMFSRYISILAVGQKKSIDTLREYSVYQLLNEFRRFNAKQEWDLYLRAKMAGAKDLKDVPNWMGDLNSKSDSD